MNKTIKTIHLAKLRVLREELSNKAREDSRKKIIAERAYAQEAKWEIEKAKCTPVRWR
jgi:hypothetical protein